MHEMTAPAVTVTEVVLPGKVEPAGLRLVQRALPPPAAGQALVRVESTAVSFAESAMRRGRYYGQPPTACSPRRSPPATHWPRWPRPWNWPSPPAGPPSARSSWCPDGSPAPAREPPYWRESHHKTAVSAGSHRLSNATE